jgi:hypothetical protein
MDPRKTVVIADFDEIVRAATEPSRSPPSAAGVKAAPTVIIGRTLVAAGEPRSLASLAKTQLWRREMTISAHDSLDNTTRPRARVQVEESVMQHLSAELWAGQAAQGSHLMVTTVRQSIVDVQATFIETRRSAPQPAIIANAEAFAKTEIVASSKATRDDNDDEPVRIPRRFQLPDAKLVRFACAALCLVSAGAMCLSTTGLLGERKPRDSGADPQRRAAAASGEMSAPMEVETTWRPARTAPPTAAAVSRDRGGAGQTRSPSRFDAEEASTDGRTQPASASVAARSSNASASGPAAALRANAPVAKTPTPSSASPRAAVDALIAGKRELALARYRALANSTPSEPAYEAAARILADAQQRSLDAP